MRTAAYIVAFTATAAALSAFTGAIFWLVWQWAAVPLGAPSLTFLHAWGVWVLISMVGNAFRSATSVKRERKRDPLEGWRR